MDDLLLNAIKATLAEHEIPVDKFDDGSKLFSFLRFASDDFALNVLDAMSRSRTEDDWLRMLDEGR